MKFLIFVTAFVALGSATETNKETRIAVIDNFVANPSIETAVDVGQWAALHFAGFYNIYLLAFEWRDNLAQYNTVSELLSWDFGYAWFKYIEPALTYLVWVIDGQWGAEAAFFARITQWKLLYNTFCGSNCDFNREAEYDFFAMFGL